MAKILKGDEFKKKLNLKERLDAEPVSTLTVPEEKGGVLDREVLRASTKGQEILKEAGEEAQRIKAEAREILAQVKQEMERAKREGFEKGHQEGLQQGLEMLFRVKELRAKLFSDNEREIIKLIYAISEKIIGRELSENDKAIMNVVRMALSDAVGEKIYCRLNPKDYENIKKNESELLGKVEVGKTLVYRADEQVQPGGCIIETEIGTIDAQLDTQLSAIKKALEL